MKRIGGLFDELCDLGNLARAYHAAARGGRAPAEWSPVGGDPMAMLSRLSASLRAERLAFGPYVNFAVRDTKARDIAAPPFEQRVVHHAMMQVCGPVLERGATDRSFACRAGRGQHAALDWAKRCTQKEHWYLKVDIRRYYDSIPHAWLRTLLRRRFREERVLHLFDRLLDSWEATPGRGLPIGALTSQYLANFALDPLDHWLLDHHRQRLYVRYMDDLVCWGTRERMLELRAKIADWLAMVEMEIKHGGEIQPCTRGLPYLGFVLYPDRVRLGRQGRRRLNRKCASVERNVRAGRYSEEEAAQRLQSMWAHAAFGDDLAWRRSVLHRRPWLLDGDVQETPVCAGHRRQPGHARRLVEQLSEQVPFRVSEQEASA
jgi:RNA-directed DNA polymerase